MNNRIVSAEYLQRVWEEEFTHHLFSTENLQGKRKFVTAVLCRDKVTYQVFSSGEFVGEYRTMAGAVDAYNDL